MFFSIAHLSNRRHVMHPSIPRGFTRSGVRRFDSRCCKMGKSRGFTIKMQKLDAYQKKSAPSDLSMIAAIRNKHSWVDWLIGWLLGDVFFFPLTFLTSFFFFALDIYIYSGDHICSAPPPGPTFFKYKTIYIYMLAPPKKTTVWITPIKVNWQRTYRHKCIF